MHSRNRKLIKWGEVLFHLTARSTKLTKDQGKCFSFLQQGLTLISTAGNLIILEFFWLRITQKQRQFKQQATKYSLHFNLDYTISQSLTGQSSSYFT